MHDIEVIAGLTALILLAILARGLFVLIWPYRDCRWCNGTGRRRRRRCWRCKGHKLTRRWGAWHVHKIKDSLATAWAEREFWR